MAFAYPGSGERPTKTARSPDDLAILPATSARNLWNAHPPPAMIASTALLGTYPAKTSPPLGRTFDVTMAAAIIALLVSSGGVAPPISRKSGRV